MLKECMFFPIHCSPPFFGNISVCARVFVFLCAWVCTCVFVCKCVHIWSNACASPCFVCLCACACACACSCASACAFAWACVCTCACACACICLDDRLQLCLSVCLSVCLCLAVWMCPVSGTVYTHYIHTQKDLVAGIWRGMCVCVCGCVTILLLSSSTFAHVS